MNPIRRALICDEIMHITELAMRGTDGRKFERTTARFGIKGMAQRLEGLATLEETAESIQWLLDEGYLNKQGKWCLGVPADGKEYPLRNYNSFALGKSTADLLQTEVTETAPDEPRQTPKKAKAMKATVKKYQIPSFTAQANTEAEQKQPDHIPDATKMTQPDDGNAIDDALLQLEQMIHRRHRIKALDQKIKVLDRLSIILPPDISDVLNQIKTDLQEQVQ